MPKCGQRIPRAAKQIVEEFQDFAAARGMTVLRDASLVALG
jgi:hypothetical protein